MFANGGRQTKGLDDSWVRHWADIDHPFPRFFLDCSLDVFSLLNYIEKVFSASIKVFMNLSKATFIQITSLMIQI